MSRVMDPLREEHKDLLPHINALRTVADSIGEVSPEALRSGVDEAYAFLVEHLIPHATAEDKVLYPTVARLVGATEATATMAREHIVVGQLTAELGQLRDRLSGEPSVADLKALRRVLYGLYTLVGTHFANEEDVFVPLLEAGLSADEAAEMFERLEAAANEAKAAVPSH